ncbi:C2H2 type zinc finger domain-containing protein [Colletotrichum camelliae]|nr:C2H2 type zinc finger domain-containing protein [Colletotrichum camelliae]
MTDADFDLNEFFNLSYFEDVSSPKSHGDRQTSVTYPPSSENPGAPTGADSKYQPQDVTTKSARISNRFSLESIRILRQWLADHNSYPYATPEDIEMLQDGTGLTKLQLTNWLSNARRRYKFKAQSGPSASRAWKWSDISSPVSAIDVPHTRASPIPFELMNPLERWESSPPEYEAANVADISRMAAAIPTRPATPYYLGVSEISSSDASSLSSAGSSGSNYGSGSSCQSRSFFDPPSLQNNVRRRRKKLSRRQPLHSNDLLQTYHGYQCTFCIETFKTKYDWHRHEKTVHICLDEWVCSPLGPTELNPDLGVQACVYCGAPEPDQQHLETHHHSLCRERDPSFRTFRRKDHLSQHLKLVHESNFSPWPMEQWKAIGRQIRSRCGFCNTTLESWTSRIDHLADHFKAGKTMADWKGDWGLDPEIADTVENDMPPYLIHYERSTPLPISSVRGSPDTPTSPYELLKLELEYFVQGCLATQGCLPSDTELHHEACSIILGADVISTQPASATPSWLRDAFLLSETANEARLLPLQQIAKSRLSQLKINGKRSIFDQCGLESELRRLVLTQNDQRAIMCDDKLQDEAASILLRAETCSPKPSKYCADFLIRAVRTSKLWIEPFRRRLRPLSNVSVEYEAGYTPLDANACITSCLEESNATNSLHVEAAGTVEAADLVLNEEGKSQAIARVSLPGSNSVHPSNLDEEIPNPNRQPSFTVTSTGGNTNVRQDIHGPFLLNDHNSYTRLAAGLSRFVGATMSPNNPNRHVPTDEELRYQARWMWFNE